MSVSRDRRVEVGVLGSVEMERLEMEVGEAIMRGRDDNTAMWNKLASCWSFIPAHWRIFDKACKSAREFQSSLAASIAFGETGGGQQIIDI
jgi:uncharacterized protein HemY